MFDTYEEAKELQIICQFCGKPKQTILGIIKDGKEMTFTLARCEAPGCEIHCFGCKDVVELATDAVSQSDLIAATQFNGW